MAVKKPRNLSSFMIYSHLKNGSFTAVKGMQRGTFSDKNGILKGNGLDLGVEPTRIFFFFFFFSTPWVSNFFLLGKKNINQSINKERIFKIEVLTVFFCEFYFRNTCHAHSLTSEGRHTDPVSGKLAQLCQSYVSRIRTTDCSVKDFLWSLNDEIIYFVSQ